jgi:hypothetical protein
MFSIRVYGGLIYLKQKSEVFRVQDIRSMTITGIQNEIIKRVSPSNTLNSRLAFALPKFTDFFSHFQLMFDLWWETMVWLPTVFRRFPIAVCNKAPVGVQMTYAPWQIIRSRYSTTHLKQAEIHRIRPGIKFLIRKTVQSSPHYYIYFSRTYQYRSLMCSSPEKKGLNHFSS